MASTVTSAYSIGVVVTADTAELATGAAQAEAAIGQLALTSETAGTAIGTNVTAGVDTAATALGTTLPAATDASAVNLTTKATKFKAVGGELGTTLAEGIAGGITSGDAIGGVSSAISGGAGLLAITAATGVGAALAVGVGIATQLVSGLVKGMQAQQDAFDAQVVAMWDSLEIEADTTLKKVKKQINDTFTLESTLKQFGVDELSAIATQFGVRLSDVVELINGKVTPATQDLKANMQAVVEEGNQFVTSGRNMSVAQNDQLNSALKLSGILEDQKAARQEALAVGKAGLQYERDTVNTKKQQRQLDKEALEAQRKANQEAREYKSTTLDTLRSKKDALADTREELENTKELTQGEKDRLEAREDLLVKQLEGLRADREAIALASRYAAQLERAAAAAGRISTRVANGFGF